jgi:iron complex transport system substrate-binding protein
MAALPRTLIKARRFHASALGLVVAALTLLSATGAAAARRVISIIPATTEMLFAMGAGDRVVAIGSYDRNPPEAQKLPRVGALLDPNIEQILAMKPDLVVLYGTQTEFKRRMERAHIPVFSYTHKGLADITETMRLLGARVGVEAAANALASGIERQLADIRQLVANSPRPKTLLVFGRERGTLRNIDASGGSGFIELRYSREDMNAADAVAWNALPAVPAVRNHRVYLLTGDDYVVPGPRVAGATRKMAAILHPEAFK